MKSFSDIEPSLLSIEGLSQSQRVSLLLPYASDWSTSPELLAQLATDDIPMIRATVGRNGSALAETLERLAKDSVDTVRRAVADNQKTPPHILASLVNDPDEGVRGSVAGNDNSSPETLIALSKDSEKSVRWNLVKNDYIPIDLLVSLAKTDPSSYVRRSCAEHPNIPTITLREMLSDDGCLVAWAAERALKNKGITL